MPHFSHTEHVAWGMTHGQADYQDLYIERFRNESGRLEYAWLDGWLPALVRKEEVAIRDGRSEMLTVVRTRHGPIVAGDPQAGYGIAFSHPGTNSGTPWANTLHDLLVAGSADEAEEALRAWTEPVNNFVYADVHGEFGYRYRGRIPIRSMANAWIPVPGWTGEHEWRGRIPFEEMPSARNPETGFVVTCNNAPTTATSTTHPTGAIRDGSCPSARPGIRAVPTTRISGSGQAWADIETIPQLWDWDDIVDAAETRQELVPDRPSGDESRQ